MQDYCYLLIGLTAMMIHWIINYEFLFRRGRRLEGSPAKAYRWFLHGIFAYYLTDALWGLLAGLGNTELLYVDTVAYYIAMSFAVLFWSRYVMTLLDARKPMARFLYWSGIVLSGFQLCTVVGNYYTNSLFWFDKGGLYHPGVVRNVVLYLQFALFLLSALGAWFAFQHSEGGQRKRNLAVLLFGTTMAIAVGIQYAQPLMPVYTIGYLVGSCVLHVFVIQNKRDEYELIRNEMDDANRHMSMIVSGLSREYQAVWHLRPSTHAIRLCVSRTEKEVVRKAVGFATPGRLYEEAVGDYVRQLVEPGDQKRVWAAIQLDVLAQKVPERGVYAIIYRRRAPDGEVAYMQITFAGIVENGETNYIVGFRDVDVAVRRQLEVAAEDISANPETKKENENQMR